MARRAARGCSVGWHPGRAMAELAAQGPGARLLSPLGTLGSRSFSTAVALAVLALSALLGRLLYALPAELAALGGPSWARLLLEPKLSALGLIAIGGAAVALPIALGMPVAVLGALATVGGAAALALTWAGASPWLLLGLLPPLVLATFFALTLWGLPGARSIASVALLAAVAALAAASGPLAVILGLAVELELSLTDFANSAQQAGITVIVVVAPLLLTWLAAEAGAQTRLDAARMAMALRDAAFRVLVPLAGVFLAVWLATSVEIVWAQLTRDSALVGLGASVGALAAVAVALPLLWAVWLLPRRLAAARWAGRIDGRVVAETLLLPAFAMLFSLTSAAWNSPAFFALNALWLPAAAAYAVARIRSARPLAAPGRPLWLVLPGQPRDSVRQLAARAARAWKAGPVTFLALPAQRADCGGDHAHCADAAGTLENLSPTHPAQMADWLAARPDPWTALPLRELYAPADLWPHILGERVERDALVLRLADRDAPPLLETALDGPLGQALQRLGLAQGTQRVALTAGAGRLWAAVPKPLSSALRRRQALAWPVARSAAPRIEPRSAGADETLVASALTEAIGGEALEDWLRAQQLAVAPAAVRQVVIGATAADAALAERIAARLDGRLDGRGQVVEAVVLVDPERGMGLTLLLRMPLRNWRLAGRLFGRLLTYGARGQSLGDFLRRLFFGLFDVGRGEFDLLVIEDAQADESAPLLALYAAGVANGALARAMLLRRAQRSAVASPAGYTAQLTLPPGGEIDTLAGGIAARVLALDFGGDRPPTGVRAPAREATDQLETKPAPPLAPADVGADDADGFEEVETVRAWAIRGAVLVCDESLPAPRRRDLMHCVLLAYLAADHVAADLSHWEEWNQRFIDALAQTGVAGLAGGGARRHLTVKGAATSAELPSCLAIGMAGWQVEAGGSRPGLWQRAVDHGPATASIESQALFRPQGDPPVGRFVALAAAPGLDGQPLLHMCLAVQLAPAVNTPSSVVVEGPAVGEGGETMQLELASSPLDAGLLTQISEALQQKLAGRIDGQVVELALPSNTIPRKGHAAGGQESFAAS